MKIDTAELLGLFLAESAEQIATLEADVLELEQSGGTPELIQELFRVAHTLKGSAASLGLSKLAEVTHALESAMGKVRDGECKVDSELVDVLLAALDTIQRLRLAAGEGADEDVDVSEVVQRLEAVALGGATTQQSRPGAITATRPQDWQDLPVLTESDREIIVEAQERGETPMVAVVELSADCALPNVRAALTLRELRELGRILRVMPPEEELQGGDFAGRLWVLLASNVAPSIVESRIRGQGEIADVRVWYTDELQTGHEDVGGGGEVQLLGEILVAEGKATREDVQEALKAQSRLGQILVAQKKVRPEDVERALAKQEQQRAVAAQGIRVDMKVLDGLMNLIGEAAVVSARVSRVTKALYARRIPEIAAEVGDLSNAADLSERISEELQTVLLDMRLLPVRTIFQKFPRVVRDVARAGNKQVELVTRGGETLVDKAVLDRLGEPLMHAIRNAADHGIESPEERQALGKSPCGTVTLSAARVGDNIIIEVADDGRGMDSAKIRRKAVEKGLITPEEAETLNEEEALRIVLRPGFSTAERVTEVSGRGVGMDVVATAMKELGGRVDILSEVGVGSTVRLTIPVKKLMMDLLLVRACGQRFGVPLEAVAETMLVPRHSVSVVEGHEATFLRGELLGLVELREVMALESEAQANGDELRVVVLWVDGRRLGLIVDRIEDHQEVMLKPLEWGFGELRGIAGAAILGNGEVVPVLDPEQIGSLARQTRARVVGT